MPAPGPYVLVPFLSEERAQAAIDNDIPYLCTLVPADEADGVYADHLRQLAKPNEAE